MVNKVILIGNLGKDPEMSYTPSGVAVTKVSLATTKKWTSGDGTKREQTEWHNLVFWRRSAEVANEYLRKGSKIYVDGEINYRSWEGNDGQKKYATDIVVNNFQFLSPRSEGGGGGQQGGGGQGGARQRSRQQQQPQGQGQGQAQPQDQSQSDGPHYEPIDQGGQGGGQGGDQGGGGQGGGPNDGFGSSKDEDLPF
ncbi:MAG TPA: single-stranded DNA-binding protein [Bacteroidetes bacterium]|nr:single-stranded DNA-binding protein [bacterium BMS3Bbin04]HDO65215.1 single-stranded DNA-binding protein [Bacteroidota bacterium]HEX04340.1 single-stranded DNA-binding protein [Bacteroidota bacterium]